MSPKHPTLGYRRSPTNCVSRVELVNKKLVQRVRREEGFRSGRKASSTPPRAFLALFGAVG